MSKGQKTKQRIIQESAAVFNTKGYAGCAVSDLLEVSGIKKGGLYRHFESKEAIALEAFDYAWSLAKAERFKHVDPSVSPKNQLLQFIEGFLDTDGLLVPGGCPLLNTAIDADDGHPLLRQKALGALNEWGDYLEGLLKAGMAHHEFSSDLPVAQATLCIMASLEGAVMISRLTQSNDALIAAVAFLKHWFLQHSLSQ